MVPKIPIYPLMFKAVTIDLVLVYIVQEAPRRQDITQLTDLIEAKALDFQIAQIFDLEDCAHAHNFVAAGGRAGSVLCKI
jgi:hypothetical protein